MAMKMLKRYSAGFTFAKISPASITWEYEPYPSDKLFKQGFLTKQLQLRLIASGTFPPHEQSKPGTEQCTSRPVRITGANDEALYNKSPEESDATLAQKRQEKAKMVIKSRVQSLRDFFGVAWPACNAPQPSEKKEYGAWHVYAQREKEMRQRYEEFAEIPADVEIMLRGWHINHPPPRLSYPRQSSR